MAATTAVIYSHEKVSSITENDTMRDLFLVVSSITENGK
jgi:hypothetical protein